MVFIRPKSGFQPDTIDVPSTREIIQLPPLFLLVLDPSVDIYNGVFCCINCTNESERGLVLKLEMILLIAEVNGRVMELLWCGIQC